VPYNYENMQQPIFYENQQHFRTMSNDQALIENVFLYIRDQQGCRVLQKKIEERNKDFLYKFYEKVQNNLIDIINDQFGNYVFQKYIEFCDKSLIGKILEKIKNSLFNIATNTHGTRVLQKMLDIVSGDYEMELLKEFFSKNFYNLVTDSNGNHVIQKVITAYPKNKNQFLFDDITKHCVDISKIKLGGCVIQKTFDTANEVQKKTLVIEIIKNIDKLINDEFGNFIIQQIIFLKVDEYTDKISTFLSNNLVALSKLKYSSNVIDKCIMVEESKYRAMFISKLISTKAVPELLVDQYGNYVVQKALSVTDGMQFMEIISMIKPALKGLKHSHFGKKIHENLLSNYGEYLQNKSVKNLSFTNKKNGK